MVEEESFYNVVGEEINRSRLVDEMINFYSLKLEAGDTKITDFNEGSEIRNLLEAFAVNLYFLMEDQNELSKIAFIETAEGEWLDKHGANPFIGLPRELGEPATGFVTFTIPSPMTTEVIIPEGTILVSEENGLDYMTDNEINIPIGETDCVVGVTCLTEGEDGNLDIGKLNIIQDEYIDINGLSVSNENTIEGGVDYEEDEEYRERLVNYVRQDDFGSIGYYTSLGESVEGVHDVYLIDDTINTEPYTKIVLVNGNIKPTPSLVLAEVLEAFTLSNNIVIGHTFSVDLPSYVDVNLEINLEVRVELDEEELETLIKAVFDGGLPVVGLEYEGLGIGETLMKTSLYTALETYENIYSVSITNTDTGDYLEDISPEPTEVLKLGTLIINQTVVN